MKKFRVVADVIHAFGQKVFKGTIVIGDQWSKLGDAVSELPEEPVVEPVPEESKVPYGLKLMMEPAPKIFAVMDPEVVEEAIKDMLSEPDPANVEAQTSTEEPPVRGMLEFGTMIDEANFSTPPANQVDGSSLSVDPLKAVVTALDDQKPKKKSRKK